MKSKADLSALVKTGYVDRRLSLKEAARSAGVSASTAWRWKRDALERGDDWSFCRAASVLSGRAHTHVASKLIEDFVRLHERVIAELEEDSVSDSLSRARALSSLASAFCKTMHAAGCLDPRLSRFAVANDVLQRLGDFVAEKFPEEGRTFLQVLESFSSALSEAYR